MKASTAIALLTLSVAVVPEFASGNTTSDNDTQTFRVGVASTTNVVSSHESNLSTVSTGGLTTITAGNGLTTSIPNEVTDLPSSDETTATSSATIDSTETWASPPESNDPTTTTPPSTALSTNELQELPSTDALSLIQTSASLSEGVHSTQTRVRSSESTAPMSVTTPSMTSSTKEQTGLTNTNTFARAQTTTTSSASFYSTESENNTQTVRVSVGPTANMVASHGSNLSTVSTGGLTKPINGNGSTTSSLNEHTDFPSSDQTTSTSSATIHSTETWASLPESNDPSTTTPPYTASTTHPYTVSSANELPGLPSTDALSLIQTTASLSEGVHSTQTRGDMSSESIAPMSVTIPSMTSSTKEQAGLTNTNTFFRAQAITTSSANFYYTEPWRISPDPNDPITTTNPSKLSRNENTELRSTDATTIVQTNTPSSVRVLSTDAGDTSLESSNSVTQLVSTNRIEATTDDTRGFATTSSSSASGKPTDVSAENLDAKLQQHLLGNYVSSARPLKNYKNNVVVSIGLSLYTILDLEEKTQILDAIVWIRLSWTDDHLKWNPDYFYGMNTTAIQSSSLWRPDITLYNSAGGEGDSPFDVTQDTMVIVTSEGRVQWNFPAKTISTCPIDITYFPFDEQSCSLEFGSWVFSKNEIDWKLMSKTGDLGSYGVNVEWVMRNVTAKKKVTNYGHGEYPTVIYTIVIQRRQMFYMFNMVFPGLLITFIGMMTFCLPPDAGEKVSLCVTMVISMALVLLLISEILPPTSLTIPLIGEFFATMTVMLTMSTILTIVVLQFHHKTGTGRPVPGWMRILVLRVLARLLCFHCACKDERKERKNAEESRVLFNKAQEKTFTTIELTGMNNSKQEEKFPSKNNTREIDRKVHLFDNPVLHEMSSNVSALRVLFETQAKDREMQDEIDTDWKTVAMVFDRLFLVLSVIITVVISLVMLLNRPQYSE